MTFNVSIEDRIYGEWYLLAPTKNDLCMLLTRLEAEEGVVRYKVVGHDGKHYADVAYEFGWMQDNYKKGY